MSGATLTRGIQPLNLLSRRKMNREIAAVLAQIPIDFGGGCSLSKARVMAELIRRYQLRTTVDIGVYRGRSFFPHAIAHACCTGGVVYGIDPWSMVAAQEHDNARIADELQIWLQMTDFEGIYQDVVSLIDKLRLNNHCLLVRQPSGDAISYFRQKNIYFDLIHIDGNHDTAVVMADLHAYVPRLKPGGFVVLDDASWDSVQPAYIKLSAVMALLYRQKDVLNDYAVFWRGKDARGRTSRQRLVEATAAEVVDH